MPRESLNYEQAIPYLRDIRSLGPLPGSNSTSSAIMYKMTPSGDPGGKIPKTAQCDHCRTPRQGKVLIFFQDHAGRIFIDIQCEDHMTPRQRDLLAVRAE